MKHTKKKSNSKPRVPGQAQRGSMDDPFDDTPDTKPHKVSKSVSGQSKRSQDPYIDRERAKYANPLPSREFIEQVLREEGVPTAEARLAEILEIETEEMPQFVRRLNAMEREGQLVRNRRGALLITEKLDLVRGKIIGHPDGFGFLRPSDVVGNDREQDLFLNAREMHKVFHGDIVLVREVGVDGRGRREAAVVEVLERAHTKLVGRLYEERGVYFVVAEDKRINQDILIEPKHENGGKPGQVVVVELSVWPDSQNEAMGRVVELLGNYADSGMEIEIALRKHDLPHVFSDGAEKAAAKLPKQIRKSDLTDADGLERKDLRKLPFVTIDGEDAKDFDDAVYCLPEGKGFRLYVAIADVSHYVRPNDAIDKDARSRSTSVYFPRRVIPMLPEALSNGLCSLVPQVDRLVLCCEMAVSAQGAVKRYEFYPAVIHSHARLTYTRVAAFLGGREADPPIPDDAQKPVEDLYAVFQALLSARAKRGAIEFESDEVKFKFNENGKIESVYRTERNEAHKLIEECMLAANVSAALYLEEREHPLLYRIHDRPSEDKLQSLRTTLKDFGLTLGGAELPSAKDYAELAAKIKGKPFAQLLSTSMLRSMMLARYSPDNVGHFGLAYESYGHFTSPIRRYPDLTVHRGIKAALAGTQYDPAPGNWEALGEHCSGCERRADEASRDVMSWLKCFFMQDKVGEVFAATVSGVTGFGLFATLDEVAVDGLIHIAELGEDYFKFDRERNMLYGERSGVKYRLGDRIWIKVVRVDLEQMKIDFLPSKPPAPKTEPVPAATAGIGAIATKTAGKRTTAVAPGKEEIAAQILAERESAENAMASKQKAAALLKRAGKQVEEAPAPVKTKPVHDGEVKAKVTKVKSEVQVLKNFRPPKKDEA